MKRKIRSTEYICLGLLLCFYMMICTARAQEEEVSVEETIAAPQGGAAETIGKKIEELDVSAPREQIAERVQAILHFNLDIAAAIQGIEHQPAEEGDVFLYNGVNIKDLDRKTLDSILRIVQQRLSMKNLQRTQQQMRALKQIQDINRISQTQKQIKNLKQM